MNSSDEFAPAEALAAAWTVETTDLTARIAAAIGETTASEPLLAELRALRDEIALLRGTAALLMDEIAQIRRELPVRSVIRLAPYAPSEGLVRLS